MTPTPARIRPEHVAGVPLRELAQEFGLDLRADIAAQNLVRGVALADSAVSAGELFAALPGARTHGASFAGRAADRGAIAVLTDPAGAACAVATGLPTLIARNPRGLLGELSARIYGAPAEQLSTFAVTGTNGKTTTTYLLAQALELLGRPTGLIGTVELRMAGRAIPARLTTPESPDLHAMLASMVEKDVTQLVMEVSSQALAFHRVDGVVFDVAGFTNLTQDHLDYHGDLESYFAAKAELFTASHARRGVAVVDDPWGARLAAEAPIPMTTLAARTGLPATWHVEAGEACADGTPFTLVRRGARVLSTLVGLPGEFNVMNAALALVMVVESGVDAVELEAALAASDGLRVTVPGRMQVMADRPRCVVDFAHNADALRLALAALRETTQGRLHVVFGATGDRDRSKRPVMGEVAVAGADVVIVTDDDPHDEDPALIRAEVAAGAARAARGEKRRGRDVELIEVAPRAVAIETAILRADGVDTVLIAGRGHEVVQEVAGVDVRLDDREEVLAALARRRVGAVAVSSGEEAAR